MSKGKSTAGNLIWIVTGLLFAFIVFGFIVSHIRGQVSLKFTTCLENLKNISGALNEYHKKNNGYPSKLSELVPGYINSIPECKGAGKDTYSAGYQVSEDLQVFTLSCHGNNHKKVETGPDHPRFYSKYGLVFRQSSKLTPLPTPPAASRTVVNPYKDSGINGKNVEKIEQ